MLTESNAGVEQQVDDDEPLASEEVPANSQQVEELERRIELQENEINVLKTSLVDMQKRLKEVEAAVVELNSKKSSPVQSKALLMHNCMLRPEFRKSDHYLLLAVLIGE